MTDTSPTARRSTAPWTPEQVEQLNLWQNAGIVHPFTCGQCRDRDTANVLDVGCGDRWVSHALASLPERALVATVDGWVCPSCDYTQNWCYERMLDGPPEFPIAWDASTDEFGPVLVSEDVVGRTDDTRAVIEASFAAHRAFKSARRAEDRWLEADYYANHTGEHPAARHSLWGFLARHPKIAAGTRWMLRLFGWDGPR